MEEDDDATATNNTPLATSAVLDGWQAWAASHYLLIILDKASEHTTNELISPVEGK